MHQNNLSRKVSWLLNLSALLLILGISLMALPLPEAQAKPRFLAGVRARYPQVADSRLDTCNLCHLNGGGSSRNSFGEAFAANGFNLAAIEPLDPDGDGYTNRQEFKALTFPGKAKDFPRSAPPATPVPQAAPDECGD
jgi:hypothetical protein